MGQAVSAGKESQASGAVASASSPAVLRKINAPDAALSPWDFPHPANLHGIRRCLPDRWMAFLRSQFQGPSHVALFFDVDRRTATDWWHGRHGVNAAPVVMAMRAIPGAAAFLLEAA